MIRLQNMTKVYPTEAKMNVIALSNVSIELGDRGLVFCIGLYLEAEKRRC